MPPLPACILLAPPYVSQSQWHPKPPLGSVLVWRHCDIARTSELLGAYALTPWCGVVIAMEGERDAREWNHVFDALSGVACLPVFMAARSDPIAAIRNRRPPTAEEIVRYMECRPGSAELGSQLRLLVGRDLSQRSRRSLRRRIRSSSCFSAGHWESVIDLIQMKLLSHESAEALAGRYDIDVRTLRQRLRRCVGVSLEYFRHRVGWEWRVEAALRIDALMRGGGGLPRVDRPMIWSHCPL